MVTVYIKSSNFWINGGIKTVHSLGLVCLKTSLKSSALCIFILCVQSSVNNVFLYILLICDMFLQNELYDKKQIELVTPLERRCKNYGHISNTAKVIGRWTCLGRKFQTGKNAFEVRGHISTQSSTLLIQNCPFCFYYFIWCFQNKLPSHVCCRRYIMLTN